LENTGDKLGALDYYNKALHIYEEIGTETRADMVSNRILRIIAQS